jgi:2-oxo-4-hydroxy-4-carboxy--5-ureidoimidazoline (OHCU) decarboxylase
MRSILRGVQVCATLASEPKQSRTEQGTVGLDAAQDGAVVLCAAVVQLYEQKHKLVHVKCTRLHTGKEQRHSYQRTRARTRAHTHAHTVVYAGVREVCSA